MKSKLEHVASVFEKKIRNRGIMYCLSSERGPKTTFLKWQKSKIRACLCVLREIFMFVKNPNLSHFLGFSRKNLFVPLRQSASITLQCNWNDKFVIGTPKIWYTCRKRNILVQKFQICAIFQKNWLTGDFYRITNRNVNVNSIFKINSIPCVFIKRKKRFKIFCKLLFILSMLRLLHWFRSRIYQKFA